MTQFEFFYPDGIMGSLSRAVSWLRTSLLGEVGEQMTTQPLPTKLRKEPLVDAVFEIRFSASIPATSVLPGFFFAKLGTPQWKVDRLPVADLPSQIRSADPNLRYQPL